MKQSPILMSISCVSASFLLLCATTAPAWSGWDERDQKSDESSHAQPGQGAFEGPGENCKIYVLGELTPEWSRAVAHVESLQTGEDCARVEVEVSGQGANVTFVTRDGRVARRRLDGPSELSSTLEALQETGGMADSSKLDDKDAPPAQGAPALEAKPMAHAIVPPSALDVAPLSFQPIFSLGLGMRGGADHLFSPTMEGTFTLDLQHWQVGLHLGVELRYIDMKQPERETGTSLTTGLLLGRREPLERLLVHYGGRLLYSTSSNEADENGRNGHRNETRLGAYVGVVVPRRSAVRFRADMAADIVPLDLGGASSAGGSASPWWATSLLLGIEFGGAR
jgi:hypothetical protein